VVGQEKKGGHRDGEEERGGTSRDDMRGEEKRGGDSTRVGYRKPVPMCYRFQYNRHYPDRNATHISVLLSGA